MSAAASLALFDLLRPAQLALALSGLAILAFGLWGLSARRRARARLVAPRQTERFLPGFSANRARARVLLAAAACALIGVALAGPVRGYTLRAVHRRGLDLVVAIDTSRSMLVRDLRPDRLTRAKREVSGLLEMLRGDRVALVAFSGTARDVAPLTHDRATLRDLLETVTPDDNVVGGTDLGAALQHALALFDGRTGAHEAIVLLTDGEDLGGKGLEAARVARERKIRVFVVGMGTEAGGKIPVVGEGGREGFVTDPSGAEVVSSLAGESLAAIAHLSGGEYLSATRSPTPLEELYAKRISRMEGRELEDGQESVPHDRFQWFLALALACMLAEAGLRERRGARRGERGRAARFAPLLLVIQAPGAAPQAPEDAPPAEPAGEAHVASVVETLREIRQRSEDEEHGRALELARVLAASPEWQAAPERERAEGWYLLGVARGRAAERAGAAAAFRSAAALAGPGELRLDSLYNAGAVRLEAAEELRLRIPEVRSKLGLPPLDPQPGAAPPLPQPAAKGKPAPDDLELARSRYREARAELALRLRAGPGDVDTRANLELIQRRLRELDAIERQREEEQPEQQQQESDPSRDPQQEQGEKQDDPQDSEQQDPSQEPEPQEPREQDDREPPKEPEQPEPGQEDETKAEDREEPGAKPASEERLLSREEIQRLLDQLQAIDEKARAVRAALQSRRRVPVERDW